MYFFAFCAASCMFTSRLRDLFRHFAVNFRKCAVQFSAGGRATYEYINRTLAYCSLYGNDWWRNCIATACIYRVVYQTDSTRLVVWNCHSTKVYSKKVRPFVFAFQLRRPCTVHDRHTPWKRRAHQGRITTTLSVMACTGIVLKWMHVHELIVITPLYI